MFHEKILQKKVHDGGWTIRDCRHFIDTLHQSHLFSFRSSAICNQLATYFSISWGRKSRTGGQTMSSVKRSITLVFRTSTCVVLPFVPTGVTPARGVSCSSCQRSEQRPGWGQSKPSLRPRCSFPLPTGCSRGRGRLWWHHSELIKLKDLDPLQFSWMPPAPAHHWRKAPCERLDDLRHNTCWRRQPWQTGSAGKYQTLPDRLKSRTWEKSSARTDT